jgi:tetratricopeptide (TPR) repeat protein
MIVAMGPSAAAMSNLPSPLKSPIATLVGIAFSVLASLQFAAMPPNEAMPKARAAATRALELDPGLAHAHTSAGAVCIFYDWDLEAARKLFAHALELNPGYTTARQWYAEYLATCERLEDSIEELRRTQALDPLSLVTRTAIEATRYFQRRYDEVIELARATLELEPNFALAYFQLGRACVQQGNFTKAIAELDRAYKMSGEAAGFGMMLGYAYAAAGRRRHAEQMLDALARRSKRRYIPASTSQRSTPVCATSNTRSRTCYRHATNAATTCST